MSAATHCIFCTCTNRLIDIVPPAADAARIKALIEKLHPTYGTDLVVMPIDDAASRYEDTFKRPPVEISEERWHEMLGVLPPVAWKHDATGESFKISERTAGTVTAIYVRIGNRHFELSESIYLPHRECIARVRAAFFAE